MAGKSPAHPAAGSLRFATFNAALTDEKPGALLKRLRGGDDRQARAVAETIQRVRPDVLVLQELDRDAGLETLRIVQEQYLSAPQNGATPIKHQHALFPPSNTGVVSPVDLDGDGVVAGPNDALGY